MTDHMRCGECGGELVIACRDCHTVHGGDPDEIDLLRAAITKHWAITNDPENNVHDELRAEKDMWALVGLDPDGEGADDD